VASPAREHALAVLLAVARGRSSLADALALPGRGSLPERERDLLHELVLGTLRRRGALDHALAPHARRPLDEVTPGVLEALRLGAYQLLFTRVKPHAAVSEAVELARSVEPRAAGFANAMLRGLQRTGAAPEPDPALDPLAWMTTAGSLPAWLAERWLRFAGREAALARARAFLEPPPTHFRVHPRAADAADALHAAGVVSRELDVPGALELASGRLAPLAARGVVYVQDAGSQLVARLAAVEGRVLDACAAPGGKALLLSDLGARVVAAEVSTRRLRTLARQRERWGARDLAVVGADGRRPPFRSTFDAVLVDAPCSGTGTLGRKPDVRWRLAPEDIPRHALRQRELLARLSRLVRPGGILVYATCSLEPEEGEEVVAAFLRSSTAFLPDELPPWAAAFRDGDYLRKDPARHGGDGFFAARLRRAG
jgi:16S rRNA (cytosine967-C5)-methyltransferase